MTDRQTQLTKMLIRIEQQLNEAEALTVQPGDDLPMIEWASATLTKVRTSIRRLEKRLRHEKADLPRSNLAPPTRSSLLPAPVRKVYPDAARQ